MTMPKPAVDFHETDLATGWEPVPGAGPGVEQKLLSGALDEDTGTGVRTRLIRFRPGTLVSEQFVHDYWEEVYLIDGALEVGDVLYRPPAYACRPPGTPHGPFKSETGCLFFEIQYYV
jgi:hypothetical protein